MLEMVLVLLLIGIIGTLSTPIFSTVIKASVSGAVDQQTAEEAYWAASRMISILGTATNGVTSANSLTAHLPSGEQTFSFANNQISLDGVLFLNQVHSFDPGYSDGLFEITIRLVDANHPQISFDVFARNAP